MIEYYKTFLGPSQLFRLYGSAIPRAMPWAIYSTVFALIIEAIDDGTKPAQCPCHDPEHDNCESYMDRAFRHPYPFSVFAGVVGFLIVFRTNISYQRYWEARGAFQAASSKWGDAATMAASFHAQSNAGPNPDPTDSTKFLPGLMHMISLLHAVAVLTLRDDKSFSNIHPFEPGITRPPPVDALDLPQEILKTFNSKWHFGAKTEADRHKAYCEAMHIHVHGGIRMAEKEILSQHDHSADLAFSGSRRMSFEMRRRIDRVFVVSGWVMEFLSRRFKCGEMDVAAPIVSRIYQVLSDGNLHYMQARKVADTPVPFPYAQMVAVALSFFALLIPLIMASKLDNYWMVAILTFTTTLTYFSLNEVNNELEEPFKYDPNELPLPHLHYEFNLRLERLLAGVRLAYVPGSMKMLQNSDEMLEIGPAEVSTELPEDPKVPIAHPAPDQKGGEEAAGTGVNGEKVPKALEALEGQQGLDERFPLHSRKSMPEMMNQGAEDPGQSNRNSHLASFTSKRRERRSRSMDVGSAEHSGYRLHPVLPRDHTMYEGL